MSGPAGDLARRPRRRAEAPGPIARCSSAASRSPWVARISANSRRVRALSTSPRTPQTPRARRELPTRARDVAGAMRDALERSLRETRVVRIPARLAHGHRLLRRLSGARDPLLQRDAREPDTPVDTRLALHRCARGRRDAGHCRPRLTRQASRPRSESGTASIQQPHSCSSTGGLGLAASFDEGGNGYESRCNRACALGVRCRLCPTPVLVAERFAGLVHEQGRLREGWLHLGFGRLQVRA